MDQYEQTAYDEAVSRGLSAKDVRSLGFTGICDLAGVDSKNVPVDFFYRNVRNVVANHLALDEQNAKHQRQKEALEAFLVLNSTNPDLKHLAVYDGPDGTLEIK